MTTGPCAWFRTAWMTVPGPWCTACLAQHDQVGAGGQADQRPARVTVHDVVAERDVRVLLAPVVQQHLEPGESPRPRRHGRGRAARTPAARPTSASGVCQAWIATTLAFRSAASPKAKSSAAAQYPGRRRRRRPAGARPRRLLAHHHDRAGRVGGRVAATDPRTIAANAPVPREPTTSIEAPDPASVIASAGDPSSWSASTRSAGGRPAARSVAAARA